MKMLTLRLSCAPPCRRDCPLPPVTNCTPGARSAKARKLRLFCGSTSICRCVMLEPTRSEEHTSELQSLMRISYAVFCLKKKNQTYNTHKHHTKRVQKHTTN